MARVSVRATKDNTSASRIRGGGRVKGDTMDGRPDGTTPTSIKPRAARSNRWFVRIPSTIARKGPSDAKSVVGTPAGSFSKAWSGSRFRVIRNAKVAAEKAAVKGWYDGAVLKAPRSISSGVWPAGLATFSTAGICVPAMLKAQHVTNALSTSFGTRSTRPPSPLRPRHVVATPLQNINEDAVASLPASVASAAIIGASVVDINATGPTTTKDDAARHA